MKRSLLFGLAAALLISSCTAQYPQPASGKSSSTTLTVFAAASLTDAFQEIGTRFETEHPDVTIRLNFAGSQTLRTQIEQGAEADVFASANMKEMETLIAANYISAEAIKVFSTNQLLVILPSNNPAGLTSLTDLGGDKVKLVLAAKEVPAGNYSAQVIEKLDKTLGNGFKDKVLANVVSYENDVRQVVAKIQLGEADAGIVYTSDAVAAPELQKMDIPIADNVIAQYPIGILTSSETAQAFIAYVLSPAGQDILNKWGFQSVK